MEKYKSLRNTYIKKQQRELEILKEYAPERFYSTKIPCHLITTSQFEKWKAELEEARITKRTHVLYYFLITSSHTPETIQEKVKNGHIPKTSILTSLVITV